MFLLVPIYFAKYDKIFPKVSILKHTENLLQKSNGVCHSSDLRQNAPEIIENKIYRNLLKNLAKSSPGESLPWVDFAIF